MLMFYVVTFDSQPSGLIQGRVFAIGAIVLFLFLRLDYRVEETRTKHSIFMIERFSLLKVFLAFLLIFSVMMFVKTRVKQSQKRSRRFW